MSMGKYNITANSWSRFLLMALGVVLVIYAIVVLFSKSHYPLLSYDEAWYASISRNMIESGNVLHQTFNGSDYFDHPPVGFWLMSLSMLIFGESELSVRLPSMMASMVAIAVLYLLGRKRGNVWSALIPSFMLASSLWFVYRARSGNLDSLLVMFFILVIFVTEKLAANPKSKKYVILTSLVFSGLMLTKTLVGLGILPAMFVIWWKQSGRKKAELFNSLKKVFGLSILYMLPWYLYSTFRYRDFLGHHFLTIGARQGASRALTSEAFQQTLLYFRSGVGKWYYPAIMALLVSLVVVLFKWSRKSYLLTDLVWFLGVSLPFLLSPKTEVWHLIPIYAPLFILIPTLISLLPSVIRRLKAYVPVVSMLLAGGVALIAFLQVREFLPLLHQSIEFDRKDISLGAVSITTPISMNSSFLPAFVYYSKQINVHPLHLDLNSFDVMTECLPDKDCNTAFVINNSEIELLSRGGISYNTIASNSSYMIIDHNF